MAKQLFRNVEYTRTKVKNNILKVWRETTEEQKHDWYLEANDFCNELSERYCVSNSIVIGILSALSPLKKWEQNKIITEQLLETKDAGHMRMLVNKALDILETKASDEEILKILNGKKISSFYLNIKYPNKYNAVIDRHSLSVAIGRKISDEEYAMTKNQYDFFENCYEYASKEIGVTPSILQSATWLKWRELN